MAPPELKAAGRVKTPSGDSPVVPLIMLTVGGYLVWFGVHYWRSANVKWPTDPVKALLQGKIVPSADKAIPASYTLTAFESGAGGGTQAPAAAASSTGNAIADDALKYVGEGYVWGGNADKPGNWDCSSFVSYVLGHDLNHSLPGGHWGDPGFPPHAHGPTTVNYLIFGQPINRNDVRAGDLVVWQTHIGIAVSNTEMVSARSADSKPPTGRGPIHGGGPPGETAHFRRVT